MSLAILSANSLFDRNVKNTEGEDIGTITGLMLDVSHGYVVYAILCFKDSMNLGDKFFAIPWKALRIDRGNENVILNVAPEILEKAEGFDKDKMPDMTDVQWNYNTYTFYGFEPYWD